MIHLIRTQGFAKGKLHGRFEPGYSLDLSTATIHGPDCDHPFWRAVVAWPNRPIVQDRHGNSYIPAGSHPRQLTQGE